MSFMHGFRHMLFRGARRLATCVLLCASCGFFAAPAYAAAPHVSQAVPQKAAPSKNAPVPGWAFQVPDRSVQKARWQESLSATLRQTTFAPSAPAGRYLQHNTTQSGKRLPPAQLKDLDTMGPPENKRRKQGDTTPVRGEFTRESTGWRPNSDPAGSVGAAPALKEERRAGAYADFHPDEDVEFKIGPEYNLGTSTLRPEQTGHANKDSAGSFGMGMKLKIDF
jgi:hypothetical protein